MGLSDVTAIIKTFERPRWLDRLIRSVRRYYPTLRIIVADDSFDAHPRRDVETLRLPSDVGLSAGRNALLRRVQTPLFLLLDDDFEFTPQTRIERLVEVVVDGKADLAGGDVVRCKRKLFRIKRKPAPYHGLIDRRGRHLSITRGYHRKQWRHLACDLVSNFFVARTADVVAMGGWDEDLKLAEHGEFFVRFQQQGLRVAYCPDVQVLHWNARPRHYKKYRRRNYLPLAAHKMGVTSWRDMEGRMHVFGEVESGEWEVDSPAFSDSPLPTPHSPLSTSPLTPSSER